MITPKTINVKIGSLIRSKREYLNLKQVDIARIINISRPQYINIELGKSGTKIEELYRISQALNCDISEIIPNTEWFTQNGNKKLKYILVEDED